VSEPIVASGNSNLQELALVRADYKMRAVMCQGKFMRLIADLGIWFFFEVTTTTFLTLLRRGAPAGLRLLQPQVELPADPGIGCGIFDL